jgi:hypothetical protein
LNSEKIWNMRKKRRLNCEMIWKIWKKGKLKWKDVEIMEERQDE